MLTALAIIGEQGVTREGSLVFPLRWAAFALVGAALSCAGKEGEPPRADCKDSICGPSSGGTGGRGGSGGGKSTTGGTGTGGSDNGGEGPTTGGSSTGGSSTGGSSTGGSSTGGSSTGGSSTGGSSTGGSSTGGSSTGGSSTGGSSTGGSSTGGSSTGGSGGCMGAECGPIATLDMEFFKCNVEPILDRSCSMLGCHGDPMRPFRMFSRGRLRNDQDLTVAENPAASACLLNVTRNLDEYGSGTIMCEGWTPHTAEEWQLNFESANSFMREGMSPDDCELLAQPTVGGLPHVDVHPFQRDDASYTMIRRWLTGEALGTTCDPGYN